MPAPADAPAFLHAVPQDALRELLRAKPAAGRVASLRAAGSWNWESLAADADRHNVGVLIRQRVDEAHALDALPPRVAAAWLADARHAALQHGLQRRDAVAV